MPRVNLHFRQGSYLGNLPMRHDLRNIGACNALCYDWIRTRMAGSAPNYNELNILNPESTSLPQRIYSLQRGYIAFREIGKSNAEAMAQIARGDGLTSQSWSWVNLMIFGQVIWNDIASVRPHLNGYAHILMSGPAAGHAFAAKTTAPCVLFDPNYGEMDCVSFDTLGTAFAGLIEEVASYQQLGPNLTVITYRGVPR